MIVLYLLFLLLAAIFFGLTAFGVVHRRVESNGVVHRRVDLLALGLLCWVLVPLFETVHKL